MAISKRRAIFTICSWNYLAYAATLKHSLLKHNPGTSFFVFVADRPVSFPAPPLGDDSKIILVDEKVAPNYRLMASAYSILEYNTSVKPHCFDYLFDVLGYEEICYIDPDIFVVSPLGELFEFLDSGDDCILTPHITSALSDGHWPDELSISRAGIYNLGFIALKKTSDVRSFVSWWRDWLETDCVVDFDRGFFVDQKFVDFAPAFIERTRVLRDPGYNLAYWNLAQRPLEQRGDKLYAAGSLVKFIHFSGVDKDRPEQFSKHQNRFTRDNIGALQPYFDAYVAALLANDRHEVGAFSKIGYGFANSNELVRENARRQLRDIHHRGGNLSFTLTDFSMKTNCLPAQGEPLSKYVDRVGRALKLLRYYFLTRLTGVMPAGDNRHELSWDFSQTYEWFSPQWHKRLFVLLGFTDAQRSGLFKFWLSQRGFVSSENDSMTSSTHGERANISTSMRNARMRTTLSARRKGLAIYGFFHMETGVGEAARSLARAFRTTGLPMSLHGLSSSYPVEFDGLVSTDKLENELTTTLLAINADNICNRLSLMGDSISERNFRIGLFNWELPVFPGIWAKACDSLDEIWAPTTFIAESLKSATTKPVRVVPYPVQLNDLDQREARAALGLPADRLIYLTTFDYDSFPHRKNPLAALRAFKDAFPSPSQDHPLLVVKCHGERNREGYAREIDAIVRGVPNIILMDEDAPRSVMRQLQAASDVFVSLHRSEGFGLNIAECMAAGKLSIATNFSGNVDFMDAENSLLINYDMIPVREGQYVAWQGQWWADPRHDDAVDALRMATDGTLRARLGRKARADIARDLSNERVGSLMKAHIRG